MISCYNDEKGELKSNDLDVYKICKDKDVDMRKIYRIIKENSFDCSLFYERNKYKENFNNFMRECDYNICSLKCDVINECSDLKIACDGSDKIFIIYIICQNKRR